jgi:hypothetical protein
MIANTRLTRVRRRRERHPAAAAQRPRDRLDRRRLGLLRRRRPPWLRQPGHRAVRLPRGCDHHASPPSERRILHASPDSRAASSGNDHVGNNQVAHESRTAPGEAARNGAVYPSEVRPCSRLARPPRPRHRSWPPARRARPERDVRTDRRRPGCPGQITSSPGQRQRGALPAQRTWFRLLALGATKPTQSIARTLIGGLMRKTDQS